MKKTLFTALRAMCVGAMTLFAVSCYDDSALWSEIEDLDARLTALEEKLNTEVATLNSKLGALETAYEKADSALLASVQKLTSDLDALDGTVDGYVKSNDEALKAAIEEYKKADETLAAVDTDILAALATMGVAKVEKNAAGNVVITFVDESTVEVGAADANANNTGLVTVVGGKWAVVGADGKTTVLDAELHPDTKLAFKVNADNSELYVSYDDGTTWEPTGVIVKDATTINVVTAFKDGEDFVTLTVGGVEYQLPKYVADNSSLVMGRTDVYFGYGVTKTVELNAEEVTECYVITKPDGWKATLDGTTLTVTAPAQELVELGAAELEGEILVHATTTTGTCKVAKIDVKTGPAFSLTYDEGKVTIFSTLTTRSGLRASFAEVIVGIMPVEWYLEYESHEQFIKGQSHETSLCSLSDYLANDGIAYVAGENEEFTYTLDLTTLTDIDPEAVYVVWALPVTDAYQYELADSKFTSVLVECEAVESLYNNVTLSLNTAGADGYYITAVDKTFIEDWFKEEGMEERETLEYYLESGLYFGEPIGPLTHFQNGDRGAMGALFTGRESEFNLSDVLHKDFVEETKGVVDNNEYYVLILPYHKTKTAAEYTIEDVRVFKCASAPMTADEGVKAAVTITPGFTSVHFVITPSPEVAFGYTIYPKSEFEENFHVDGELDEDALLKEVRCTDYTEEVDENQTWGIGYDTEYVMAIYSELDGKYWVSTESFKTGTFAEHVASLEDGETLKLTSNVTLSSSITIDKKVTINLNRKTIKSSATVFYITTEGELTISNGNVETTGNVFYNNGTLTIDSGTYKTTGDLAACVYCDGPIVGGNSTDYAWNLTINGGTFVSEKQTALSLQNNYYNLSPAGSAVINAGTFTGATDGAAYDMYVGCAKVTVDLVNCTFTNERIYTNAIPGCPAWINDCECPNNGLFYLVPNGKQFTYYSEDYGMNRFFDLNLTTEGVLYGGIDYDEMVELYQMPQDHVDPNFVGKIQGQEKYENVVITPTGVTSGRITASVSQYNWFDESYSTVNYLILYSDYDGKTIKFFSPSQFSGDDAEYHGAGICEFDASWNAMPQALKVVDSPKPVVFMENPGIGGL